jgi:uncharacterized cupredoxin-like copper-binding protein
MAGRQPRLWEDLSMREIRWIFLGCALVALTACGSSSKPAAQSSGGATTTTAGMGDHMGGETAECKPVGDMHMAKQTVDVTLSEWKITPAKTTFPAGMTHFAVKNDGTEKHEFAVVAYPTASIGTNETGAVDESTLGTGLLLGRVEMGAGQSCDLTVDMKSGFHTLMCNLAEDMGGGEMHVHYAKGMHTQVTVS